MIWIDTGNPEEDAADNAASAHAHRLLFAGQIPDLSGVDVVRLKAAMRRLRRTMRKVRNG